MTAVGSSGFVSWLLLGVCLLAGVSPALWTAAGLLIWLAPAFYPSDLKRPRGFGAWALWTCWAAVAAFFCREPLMAAGPCAQYAAGVVLFALVYSWWGRPHRRAWLCLLWTAAALWGGYDAYFLRYDVAGAGLLIAALGACARSFFADIQEGHWKWLPRGLAVLYLAMAAAFIRGHGPSSPAFSHRLEFWRAGLAQVSARPITGVGPGLFEKGALRYCLSPQRLPSWDRSLLPGTARSQWIGAAAETGAAGLALLILAIFYSVPRDFSRDWERKAASGAFLGLAVFAAFEEVLKSPILLVLWFSALGCAAPGFEEQEARPFRLSLPAALLGAASVLACAVPALYVKRALKTGLDLQRASALSPADAGLAAELARRELSADPARVGSALAWLDRAIEESPRDAFYLHRKAELFKAVGAGPEAALWEGRAAALERDVP